MLNKRYLNRSLVGNKAHTPKHTQKFQNYFFHTKLKVVTMLQPLDFYLSLGIGHNFPRKMRQKMMVLGGHILALLGGTSFLVSFSEESCDQHLGSVVSAVYYSSIFFILPWLRLGKSKKLFA